VQENNVILGCKNMNIWKIATRWSDAGDPDSSIIDIFRKYNVVFAGRSQDYIKGSVKPDDIIAISDGITVVSVGKVIDSPKPLTEFQFDESDINSGRFDYDNWVIGFKVKLFDLNNKDCFDYRQGTFHGVNEPYRTKIKSLFEKYNEDYSVKSEFSISAKTCTLKYNSQKYDEIILNDTTKYIIPIYQRPYSWSEEQIRKFISDIFRSYYGYDKETPSEPMFIGTMQLSAKKYITENKTEQDIIDGQQRLTTFLVLIKLLKTQHFENTELKNINLNWLETRVNNGEQNKYLAEFIESDLGNISEQTPNPYIRNSLIIKELLNEEFTNDKGEKINFDISNFLKYILSNIHFVVIETFAGLSKTLQIFDAINTTGLDLNGGDIFKIRMYEYLTDKKGYGEQAFDEISKLYAKIDNENKNRKLNISISNILEIYQYILIAKYDLPNVLYTFGTHTFFERLFDTIFNINQWKHFKNAKYIELSLTEIDRIIVIRYIWEEMNYPSVEDACLLNLIWGSRYGKYWILLFVFIYRFKDDENLQQKLFLFIRQLGKVFILYSVSFEKAIGNIHSFVYDLLKKMFSENIGFEEVIKGIKDKMFDTVPYYWIDGKEVFKRVLNGNIVYNAKKKNILCRLSAMIEEDYNNSDINRVDEIRGNLFYSDIDIEHIQSYNDQNLEERESIKQQWGDELNSIGNLMVLESHINRSINNKPYSDKIIRYKEESKFKIVKKQADKYYVWNLENCKKRKETEIEKLVKYLFEST
jgi:uncharacterized protein with ParB-like and HNH nuclease domain